MTFVFHNANEFQGAHQDKALEPRGDGGDSRRVSRRNNRWSQGVLIVRREGHLQIIKDFCVASENSLKLSGRSTGAEETHRFETTSRRVTAVPRVNNCDL